MIASEKGLVVLSFYNKAAPFFGVDLFVEYPMDFAEMRKRSVVKPAGKINVRVAAIDDLIAMKIKSGRPKDLDDVQKLEEIKRAGT